MPAGHHTISQTLESERTPPLLFLFHDDFQEIQYLLFFHHKSDQKPSFTGMWDHGKKSRNMKLPATSSSRHVRQMSLFPSKMKTILLEPSEFHVVPGSLGTQVSIQTSVRATVISKEKPYTVVFIWFCFPHYKSFLNAANSKLVSWNY